MLIGFRRATMESHHMNVEIRHLRQFLAVAEELHFSRAADRLHLAQPALSANIRKLEDSLQLRLFERNTRSVELTNEGKAFAAEARAAVEAYDRALHAAARLRGAGTGAVTLGVYPAVGPDVKRSIVTRLREINPDIELTIVAESTVKLVESVGDGSIDAALCVAPLGTGHLRRMLIANEPLVAALPDTHELATRESIRLDELRDEAWILPSNRAFRENSILSRLCAEAGFTMRLADVVSDYDHDFSNVADGLGIAVVPAGFVGAEVRDTVVFVPITGVATPIYLIARPDEGPHALQAVIQAVAEATAAAPSLSRQGRRVPAHP